jgi:hypothetical protein
VCGEYGVCMTLPYPYAVHMWDCVFCVHSMHGMQVGLSPPARSTRGAERRASPLRLSLLLQGGSAILKEIRETFSREVTFKLRLA